MLDLPPSTKSTFQAHARGLGDMPQDSSENWLYLCDEVHLYPSHALGAQLGRVYGLCLCCEVSRAPSAS